MSRPTPFVATVVSLPLILTGCGLGPSIAGLHPAPHESSDGASISQTVAADVTSRVLEEAAATRSDGKATGEERKDVFTGPALRAADAAARSKDETNHPDGSVEDLQVLTVSRGTAWPRTVVATSQEEGVQFLHVLVATTVEQPYRLFADVPMAAGASVPALASVGEGSPVTIAKDPGKDVATAVGSWAKGVAYEPPKKDPEGVSFDDVYSTALRKNAEAKDEDLGDLAKYSQKQTTADVQSLRVELAAGGHLAFVPMARTDTITAKDKLKKLKIKDKDIRRVLDKKAVTKKLSVTHAETLAVVVPAAGDATIVGVSDVLATAKGK